MATYAKEKGFTVQTLSTDPVDRLTDLGSWASSPAVNTGRAYMGSAGSYTAQLIFGGAQTGNNYPGICESWNGSAWTELND